MRASQPALLAAGRVIAELRDQMVAPWADWLGDRITAALLAKGAETEFIRIEGDAGDCHEDCWRVPAARSAWPRRSCGRGSRSARSAKRASA